MTLLLLWAALGFVQEPEGRIPVRVTYEDGLWFKSDDGAYQVGVGGRVVAQGRAVSDRPADDPPSAGASRTQPNSFYLRTARIELQGILRREFEFKLQLDFPSGVQSNTGAPPSSVTGTLQDAYLGWRPSTDFAVRIGQFKEPFGQEQMTSFRAIEFVERAVLDRLTPARDIGVAFQGRALDGVLDVEVGAFNGNGRAVADANDEKDVAGRIRVMPFKGFQESFLRGLRLGIAGTVGDIDPSGTNPADPLDLTSTELLVKYLDAGGVGNAVDGRRTRLGLEFSWIWDAFSLRAEWIRRRDTVVTAAGEDRLPTEAYSVSASAVLTGEMKILDRHVLPAHPVGLEGGWGALEVALRFARLHVDDEIFSLGIAGPGNANAVSVVTGGINWYPTRFLRISPDVIVENYNHDIAFSGGRTEHRFFGFLMRVQVDF